MFLVIRLFDAAADPLIGLLADRTQTRWGKFRPWILWTSVPWAVCMILAYTTPEGWSTAAMVAGSNDANFDSLRMPILRSLEADRFGLVAQVLVARDGTTRTINYNPPRLKIDYAYLILSFIGFLYLAIGLFTLFRGETGESLIFYFVTLLSFIVYVYTPAGDIDWSYKALQMTEEMARIFLPQAVVRGQKTAVGAVWFFHGGGSNQEDQS